VRFTGWQGREAGAEWNAARTPVLIPLTDVVKDLAEMKADLAGRFEAHQRVHDQDHADRISGRRWLIGTGIAGLGAMGAVLAMLADILQHIHGG